jgi:hypothetical protein
MSVIAKAILPVPPKSSCYFCPFKTISKWQEMRNDEPALFDKSVELEKILNNRRVVLGKDQVWLSGQLKPLDKATTELEQQSLFSDDIGCDSGYCWT